MSLSCDGVYRLMAIARGDIPASTKEREAAQGQFHDLLEQWTRQLQGAEPEDLSIIRESVRETVEEAYRDYRRRCNRAATRRRLRKGVSS
ncbi:MAG: hypothetical protein O2960_03055 [Verrucomicrobia bacterium]|nr:hypothetical protein [Verrucomicrobiota bacterium]